MRSAKLFAVLCLLPLLSPLLFGRLSHPMAQETDSELMVPWASSAEADGFIKPGEYDDAIRVNLTRDGWVAYLYVKHDGEFLYVFLDQVSDEIFWYDNCWVAIDTLSDGGDAPRDDDYLFDSSHHIWIGDTPHQKDIPNGQWTELKGHRPEPYADLVEELAPFLDGRSMGWSRTWSSPNSLKPHVIYEIRIPIKGWIIEQKPRFGFLVAAGSPGRPSNKAVWPSRAFDSYSADFWAGEAVLGNATSIDPQVGSFPPPSTWGTVTLSETPPQDSAKQSFWTYIIVTVAAVVGITVVVLLLRKLR